MARITRRHFFGYASHSMLAAALSRTFLTTAAFGAVARKKLLICTTPNGHHNPMDTASSLLSGLGPAALAQALIINGLNNAVTQNGQDWHGGESALLSFATNKERGPSFFTSLGLAPGDIRYLSVDPADRHYAIDSGRQPIKPFEDPALAMQTIFGQSLRANLYQTALVESGKKHVLDSCLDDIKKIRQMLGTDKHIFDDYLYHLQEQYKVVVQTENPASPGSPGSAPAGSPGPGGRIEGPSCNKAAAIAPGMTPETKHQALLDVAFQIMACDAAQVVVVSFLNNNTDPQHNFIHSQGSNDGGAAFKKFTTDAQLRISKMINNLAQGPYNILNDAAVVYISEGGAHAPAPNGPFNSGHPTANIPCAVFGKLGGALSRSGTFDATGQTNRNLWRQLADGLAANGQADITAIGGAGITPLGI